MYVKKNDWAKWTAIDEEGERCEFENKPKLTDDGWILDGTYRAAYLYTSTDSSDWKNSLIEIDKQDKPYVHKFVNDWAVAFAVDMSGKGYEYTVKELLTCTDVWVYSHECNGKGKYIGVDHEYKGDWKESLQIRKEDSEIMDKDNNKWNGEGMPPTGTICEVLHNSEWERTYIVGRDELGNTVYDCEKIECQDNLRYSGWSCPNMFRPIKTPKQKIIEDALFVMRRHNGNVTTECLLGYINELYSAGLLVDTYSNSNP